MASLNLSANGPSISKSYQSVVDAPLESASSSTYGQWAVFSVSTPLVNAFQQDSGSKESVLKVQSTGQGDLQDLIEEFSEGRIQFAYVKVKDPNTGLPKNVLIAWCGEGVPERTKGYFTSHLAVVSKFLHGYHVQITARSDRDLTPEGIVQKVADASGAKYSAASEAQPPVNVSSKPSVATKPVFTPKRTGVLGPSAMPATGPAPGPAPAARAGIDDDGWGPDAPPVSRTELEKVQPAYKPTKVNLQELRSQSQNQPAATFNNERDVAADTPGVVKGGYQPVGKVDIDAIRRQAREAGDVRDERPEPVRGTYEPVGKVDIAAIRAKAQKPSDATRPTEHAPAPFSERQTTGGSSERLVSLPKPKVANKFGAAPAFAGTKPPLPTGFGAATTPSAAPVGIASRTFADEGGKTPAQLWAERKARERGASGAHDSSSGPSTAAPIPSQTSGSGQWKSSYSGKSWAPVQTTPTGKSAGNDVSVPRAELANEEDRELESQPSVSAIREQLSSQTERVSHPGAQRNIPMPGLASGPTEPEAGYEAETEQPVPTPPPQPRSPTPPTPAEVREASPIRVAMPVGRAVADAHEEQQSSAPAMPVESLQEAVPAEEELEEPAHDIGRAAAEVTANDPSRTAGVRAVVQYDYEKAEDNEIELREGEYVTDIEMVDKDWWLGVNAHGERGLFPSNYVEILEGDQEEEQPSSTAVASHEAAVAEPDYAAESQHQPHAAATGPGGGPTATALYDYEAAEDNEISFPEGALITDLEFPDDDWWLGEFNGQKGLFPANYVQLNE